MSLLESVSLIPHKSVSHIEGNAIMKQSIKTFVLCNLDTG